MKYYPIFLSFLSSIPFPYILNQVEREKLVTEELAHKSIHDREGIDRNFQRMEEDNITLQRQLQELQAHLGEAEQAHAQRYGRFLSSLILGK